MSRAMATMRALSTSERVAMPNPMPPSDCEVLTFPVSPVALLRLTRVYALMQFSSMVEASAAAWSTAFATSMFHASTLILAASQITSDSLQVQKDIATRISALRCGEQCGNLSVMASPSPTSQSYANSLLAQPTLSTFKVESF